MSNLNFKAKIFNLKNSEKLYHLGTLDISNKSINSKNGNGLSITLIPTQWKSILKNNSENKIWSLHKENIKLIDYNSLTNEDYDISIKWALDHKYIEKYITFKINIFDKTLGFNKKITFNSFDEIYESGYLVEKYENYDEYEFFKEYEKVNIERDEKYIPTNKMKSLSMINLTNQNIREVIMFLFLELNSDVDGLYWNEITKISNESHSNGILFNSKVNTFSIKESHFCFKCEDNLASYKIKDRYICEDCSNKMYKKDKLNKKNNYYTCGKCKKKFFYAFGKCSCYEIL